MTRALLVVFLAYALLGGVYHLLHTSSDEAAAKDYCARNPDVALCTNARYSFWDDFFEDKGQQ